MHQTLPLIVPVRSTPCAPVRVVLKEDSGRSVVAERDLSLGELIERAPVVIIPEVERATIEPTNIGNYIFMWEHDRTGKDLCTGYGRVALVLGYASLVNHSSTPNCDTVRYIEALAHDLIAIRPIGSGEELTIDYGMTLWFTPV
jgi:SET domain-containing protein